MSIESLAIALNHSRARGASKLVLIGIANHDGDGGAWPSVATLARYAGVHPRNVQKSIDQLINMGEIRREIQRGGTARTESFNRPNLYTILLECPPECDRSRNHKSRVNPLAVTLTDDPTPAQVALLSAQEHPALDPLALAPPEPSFNQTTNYLLLRTSPNSTTSEPGPPADFIPEDPCPQRPTWPCSPNKTGHCIDCGKPTKGANHDND
jgi:hypothetical protein